MTMNPELFKKYAAQLKRSENLVERFETILNNCADSDIDKTRMRISTDDIQLMLTLLKPFIVERRQMLTNAAQSIKAESEENIKLIDDFFGNVEES